MAAATFVFHNAAKHLAEDVDWVNDTIKVTLHSSSYTPDLSHEFFDDASNELSSGNGYTSGGATLTNKSVNVSTSTTSFRANAVTWTPGENETLSARYAIVWKDTSTPSTSPLLCYVLLDTTPADASATNGNFTITWHSTDGVFKIVANPS